MGDKTQGTEEQIFDAASRVFQRKGYAGARMQDIADEAKINKSMLHYYFRSKEKLFQQVYQRKMGQFLPVIFNVLNSKDPLDIKVEQLIDAYYSFLNDNPKMAQFVINEMNQNPDRFHELINAHDIKPPKAFKQQVQKEIEAGNMDPVEPEQLFISIVGLTLFPYLAQVMIRGVFEMDEQEFLTFLQERKTFLASFILNGINYERS